MKSKLDSIKAALQETPPAVEKAKTAVEQGEKLINERQKLIRIADRSEHGWATVEEYKEDELAEDSDVEKKLFKVGYGLEENSAKRLPRARGKRLFGSLVRVGTRTGGSQMQVFPLWAWMFCDRSRVLAQAMLPLRVLASQIYPNWVLASFVGTWAISRTFTHCGLSYVHSRAKMPHNN